MADKGKPYHGIAGEDRRDRLLAITVQLKGTRVSSVRTWNDNVSRFDGYWNSMLSRKEQAIKKKNQSEEINEFAKVRNRVKNRSLIMVDCDYKRVEDYKKRGGPF